MKPLTIERLPIASLNSDPANLRQHPPESIAAIKASYARFGQQRPIVIDSGNVVRAGNGELEAAKMLGWTEIDCVRSELAGSELTAFSLADNRSQDLSTFAPEVADVLAGLKAELDLSPDFQFDALIAEFSIPADASGTEFDESCADDVAMLTCPHCGKEFPK
jgi:ParB-like chromosome segregation protein Spo0J